MAATPARSLPSDPGLLVALSLLFNLSACGFLILAVVRLAVLPTSWRVAGRRFFDPGGRPGPGLAGFGAPAGTGSIWRRFRNPRRTRAGGEAAGLAGLLPGQPDVGGEGPGEV